MKNYWLIGLMVVLFTVAGFWAGLTYGQSQASGARLGTGNFTGGRNFNVQMPQSGQPNGMLRGGNMTTGEILSKDAQSMTLKMPNGGSMIVFYSSTTALSKSIEANATDLEVGKNVVVTGKNNADGSINAQNIQLREFPKLPESTQPASGSDLPK